MIFEQDLKKERQQKWNVADGARPLRTLDDAREFLNSVGFCLAYPVRNLPAPTFIGAYNGSEEDLPSAKQAFEDENAKAATELIVRLLKEKAAFEVAFGEDASLLVSAAEFPYFYALVGDRNPKVPPSPGPRGEQALTTHTFEIIDEHGPISEDEMRRKLGREISRNAIEKVLHTLWSKLRITRVDEGLENGEPVEPVWDMMHRFAPEQINRGKQISAAEALSALISKYLETVVSAEQKDVEEFFSRLVPRSRVTEVCKAMLGAQEFTFVQVSGKTMLRLAGRGGEESESAPVTEHKARPWQAREQGKRAEEEKRTKFAERPPKRDATQSGGAFQKFAKDKPRKPFGERKPFGDRKEFGERKPSADRKEFGARGPKKFGERKPFSRDSKPFAERKSFSSRPAFGKDRPPRPEGDRPAFKKSFGERKPFSRDSKPSGERKSFSDRPKPFGPRKSFGESGKSFSDRKSGARSAGPTGDRPFKKPFGDRKPFGERKSFGDRPPKKAFGDYPPRERSEGGEFKKPFAGKRSFGDKKPFVAKKSFGDKKSFGAKKSFGGSKSFGDKKPFGAKKSFGGPKSFGGKKPFGKPFAKRKPPAGDRPTAKRREEPSE